MKAAVALLLFSALLCTAAAVEPVLAMRCGSRLISEGDPKEKLANECGPPTNVETAR
jgi:hypothetical protein